MSELFEDTKQFVIEMEILKIQTEIAECMSNKNYYKAHKLMQAQQLLLEQIYKDGE